MKRKQITCKQDFKRKYPNVIPKGKMGYLNELFKQEYAKQIQNLIPFNLLEQITNELLFERSASVNELRLNYLHNLIADLILDCDEKDFEQNKIKAAKILQENGSSLIDFQQLFVIVQKEKNRPVAELTQKAIEKFNKIDELAKEKK